VTSIGVTGHQVLPAPVKEFVAIRLPLLVGEPHGRRPTDVTVSSLAAGADQLVARYMIGLGAKLLVVIPCMHYERTFKALNDLHTYRRLLAQAAEVERLPFLEPNEEAFMAAGRVVVDKSDWLLAIWDGEKSRGLGGTADVVAYARQLGKRVEVIWPDAIRR
jgi:hypothetical protein